VYVNRPHHWDESEIAALIRCRELIEAMLDAALQARQSGELADQLE
jgi:hypothetical protein